MFNSAPARTVARRIGAASVAALVLVVAGVWALPTRPGETDGALPEGVRVADDGFPAVANLDPGLRRALGHAARDAATDGIEIVVKSGWRSRAYQKELLREAVAKYGSPQEAARWVATPDRSSHVSGQAVDIGPGSAAAWLSRHGAAYRLCQIYRNEPWHFELRAEAGDRRCPPMYADARQDPRMRPVTSRVGLAPVSALSQHGGKKR
jgi:zinc D-Ala-D-Ala carboxypeptidase